MDDKYSADIHHHLGKLEGRMSGLEDRQTQFEMRTDTSLGLLLDKIDTLMDQRAAIRGSWQSIMAVCSVVVFLTGLATWSVTHSMEKEEYKSVSDARVERLLDTISKRLTDLEDE